MVKFWVITLNLVTVTHRACHCHPFHPSTFLTRYTNMTATTVELLTEAGAALLLGSRINMDDVWPVLHILGQHRKARAIILPSPEYTSLGPVRPENILLEDRHGKRVHNAMYDHLSVLASERRSFYFVSVGRVRVKIDSQHLWAVFLSVMIKDRTYNEASAQ